MIWPVTAQSSFEVTCLEYGRPSASALMAGRCRGSSRLHPDYTIRSKGQGTDGGEEAGEEGGGDQPSASAIIAGMEVQRIHEGGLLVRGRPSVRRPSRIPPTHPHTNFIPGSCVAS